MTPQSRIAHYRIIAKLGEGGMGEVWRATDTKLGRDVAIKILAGRVCRRSRAHGARERIAQGALPLEEALPIARHIAEALEYAHERGIVHRDLKPANIKITPEGKVKVLDFGLAKAISNEAFASNPMSSLTLTMQATQLGMIMGTAAYMSPEQAKGKRVDRRADIWAFGVMLYEMLTGVLPFPGDTLSEVIAAVLKEEPDWGLAPTKAQALLRSCLQKDPQRRLRDIADGMLLLETAVGSVAATEPMQWDCLETPWAKLLVFRAEHVISGIDLFHFVLTPEP
jgi:serine/threonine-protein kinase